MSAVGHIYEFLVYRKPGSSELMPGVAEKWDMSPDGQSWTFRLRKGIQFQGGWGELTAADVKFTGDLFLRPQALGVASYLRAAVQSIEAPDPYTVIFNLKQPAWDLAYRLSTGIAYFGIASKKYVESVGLDKARQQPIGSGPYRFVEYKPEQYFRMEALDNHWRQVPYFKTVIVRPVPEEAARVAMLKTGEADVAEITPYSAADLKRTPGLRVLEQRDVKSVSLQLGGLVLPTRPSYDSTIPWVGPDASQALKVRKAIALAINKGEIIDYVLGGLATPLVIQGYFPDMPQTNPAWKPYPYDPTEAKRLLAEAGYPNGFDLTVRNAITTGRPEHGIVAEAAGMQLEKIGIRTKIETLEKATHDKLLSGRTTGRAVFPLSASRMDEPVALYQVISTSVANFLWVVEEPKLDEFVGNANKEMDSDKRIAVQRNMGQWLIDNYYSIGIASMSALYGANERVGEWPQTPNMSYAFYYEYLKHGSKP